MGLESFAKNGSAMPSLGNTYNATFGAPQMNTQHLPTPSDSYNQSSGSSWLGNLGNTALGVLGSGLMGGLGGLVSSGLGALGNLIFGKKQPSQKELAQMQLENQKDLARYTSELQQQSWLDQFSKMNEREDWLNANAAAIQKASMKAAGLSVAGFGEGGLSSMASAASPSGATPQTGSGLPSALPSNLAQMTSAFNQSSLLRAQIDNIDAQTEKLKTDTVGQTFQNKIFESDSEFRDSMNKQHLDILGQEYILNLQKADINDADLILLKDRHNEMVQSIEHLKAQTRHIGFDEMRQMYEMALSEDKFEEEKRRNKALEGIAYKQYLVSYMVGSAQCKLLSAQEQKTLAEKKGVEINNAFEEYNSGKKSALLQSAVDSSGWDIGLASSKYREQRAITSKVEYDEYMQNTKFYVDMFGQLMSKIFIGASTPSSPPPTKVAGFRR